MKIFILTGAGVSAESGLGTFRDVDGLWTKYDLNDVCTPEGFARNPQLVQDFYNARRRNLVEAEPNAAHFALGRLETALTSANGSLFLCTQNIDDLHEKGGSTQVAHMHGELGKVRCANCEHVRVWREDLTLDMQCPACGQVGTTRPHVVWFGETPLGMEEIYDALLDADLFVAIGTSGAVYPAAGFVSDARQAGVRTCEINLEPSDNAYAFDERRYGPATEVVAAWVDEVVGAL